MDVRMHKLGVGTLAVSVLAMASGAAALPPMALADEGAPAAGATHVADEQQAAAGVLVSAQDVRATFSYGQGATTPTERIARVLGDAPRYLCGAQATGAGQGAADVASWQLRVTGSVQSEITATLGELADDYAQTVTMSCTCAGNPADGLASVTAQVEGVPVQAILNMARPTPDANTLVVTTADGYEVALPLAHFSHRLCLLAFSLNDEPLAGSVGGTNQLWLGSTSANYFARNVVELRVEARAQAPEMPRLGENMPNVGVVEGEAGLS